MNDTLNLDYSEAQTGAAHAIENAQRLKDSAAALAEREDYASGISLLVLAAEEAVKAFLFSLHIIESPLPNDLVQDLLRHHRVRHAFSSALTLLSGELELAVDAEIRARDEELEKWKERDVNPEDPAPGRIAVIARLLDGATQRVMSQIQPTEEWIEESAEAEWWENANRLKMAGLYVDPTDEGWQTPQELDEEDYREAVQYAGSFVEEVAEGISVFTDMPPYGAENLRRIMKAMTTASLDELEASSEDE